MPSRMILPIIIIVGLLVVSCGGGATPTPSAVDASALYETNCVPCHGANRQGITQLGLALTPESLAALSDAEVRDAILNGRTNTAMAPFKSILSSDEIDALTHFIKYTSP